MFPDRRAHHRRGEVRKMSPTLQFILVGVLVAIAAGYVLRAAWKTLFGKTVKGCGSGCGKCASPSEQPKPDGRFPLPMS